MSGAFWNGIIADHAASQVRATKAVTPTYRGWEIGFEYGYHVANHPDFDASYEGPEDGWVDSHPTLQGRTLDDLKAEIDAWVDENSEIAS